MARLFIKRVDFPKNREKKRDEDLQLEESIGRWPMRMDDVHTQARGHRQLLCVIKTKEKNEGR